MRDIYFWLSVAMLAGSLLGGGALGVWYFRAKRRYESEVRSWDRGW